MLALYVILVAAVIFVMLVLDSWLDRLFVRVIVKLIDRLPPWRPNGRYRFPLATNKLPSLRKPKHDG